MNRKKGLGKGLDALIRTTETKIPATGISQVESGLIDSNPQQPRTIFTKDELSELAESIREHGVIQPLIVSNSEKEGRYILIAGERRLKASQLAGLTRVPVVIREARNAQEFLELALVENVQRSDLSPLETAEAYQYLCKEFSLSQEEVARKVGKSRVAVTNTIGLLDLANSVKEALAEKRISEGHARALKALRKKQAQNAALQTVLKNGLNVRQTEDLVRRLKGAKQAPVVKQTVLPEIKEMQEKLRDALGTKVSLRHGKKGGTIVINYYSDEEYESLTEKLLKS